MALTISMELLSRSSRLTKAMTSLRSSCSCSACGCSWTQSSGVNRILRELAMPAQQLNSAGTSPAGDYQAICEAGGGTLLRRQHPSKRRAVLSDSTAWHSRL